MRVYIKKNRPTPWGNAQTDDQYEKGISFVTTAGHGGYLVGKGYARKHLSIPARVEGEEFGSFLAYEEDCAAAIVEYELLKKFGDKFNEWLNSQLADLVNHPPTALRLENSEKVIRHYFPEYFEEGHQSDRVKRYLDKEERAKRSYPEGTRLKLYNHEYLVVGKKGGSILLEGKNTGMIYKASRQKLANAELLN